MEPSRPPPSLGRTDRWACNRPVPSDCHVSSPCHSRRRHLPNRHWRCRRYARGPPSVHLSTLCRNSSAQTAQTGGRLQASCQGRETPPSRECCIVLPESRPPRKPHGSYGHVVDLNWPPRRAGCGRWQTRTMGRRRAWNCRVLLPPSTVRTSGRAIAPSHQTATSPPPAAAVAATSPTASHLGLDGNGLIVNLGLAFELGDTIELFDLIRSRAPQRVVDLGLLDPRTANGERGENTS